MMKNTDKIADVTLALMHLGILRQNGSARARKMYPPEALRLLKRRGYITEPSAGSKTTPITEEGVERARELYSQYFGDGAAVDAPEPAKATYVGGYPDPERDYEAFDEENLQRIEMLWFDATSPLDTEGHHSIAWYFDTVDHAWIMIDRDYFGIEPDPDEIHSFDREIYEEQRRIDEDAEGRYRLFSQGHDAWRVMERFTRGIEPPDVADEFDRAIRGRGAFRYFRDRLREFGLQDEWNRYQTLKGIQRIHGWFASAGFRLVLTDPPDWLADREETQPAN